MKKYETVEFELDTEILEKIQATTEELNMSFNEFVNSALDNYISEEISSSEFLQKLSDMENYNLQNYSEFWKKFYTIIDSDTKKPIARIRPIS